MLLYMVNMIHTCAPVCILKYAWGKDAFGTCHRNLSIEKYFILLHTIDRQNRVDKTSATLKDRRSMTYVKLLQILHMISLVSLFAILVGTINNLNSS